MSVERQQGRAYQGDLFDEALLKALRPDASGDGGTEPAAGEESQALACAGAATSLDARPDGAGGLLGQPEPGLQAGEGEQGGAGGGRHDRLRPALLDRRQQGCAGGPADAGRLPTTAGQAGGDPEAERRDAPVGHPNGGRPSGSAGHSASPAADPGAELLDLQFRFPPGPERARALAQAGKYVSQGYGIVVDLDLEKFFDRVNHDILMARLARRIGDKRLLRIIRRFLEAGMMAEGVCVRRQEGTPQGGPLSPLLANVLLDDLDKMLEARGHRFCRYADDVNIYV